MVSPENKPQEGTDAPDEKFQLSPGWLLVGLLAIVLGIICGFVMSSATLIR